MRKVTAKPPKPMAKKRAPNTVLIPTWSDDLTILLGKKRKTRAPLKAREISGTLLVEAEKALRNPGIDRSKIFTATDVSSYSVFPEDPSLMVREKYNGDKAVGKMAGGRFRVRRP